MLGIIGGTGLNKIKNLVVDSEEKIESNLILSSPSSSRLVLIASNSFAADGSIDIASHSLGTLYTKPLEFIQNAFRIDKW